MTENDSARDRPTGALEAVRAFFGSLDLIIGILLAAMLLPLLLGPIVVPISLCKQVSTWRRAPLPCLLRHGTWWVDERS